MTPPRNRQVSPSGSARAVFRVSKADRAGLRPYAVRPGAPAFQAARNLLPGAHRRGLRTLDQAIREGDEAIAEGRDAIQGLRPTRRWRAIWKIC